VNDSASGQADFADASDATLKASLAEGGQEACDELVAKTEKDPGAPFAVISDLAALKQANRQIFENLHRRLKKAGCRVSELDKLINAENGGQSGREPTQAEVLVELSEVAELFHAPDDVAYADVEVEIGGVVHRETWPIKSRGFRRWLENLYFAETRGAPNSEAMRSALSVIEAQAHHGAPVREVHTRIGAHGGKLYLDLCDETWRAVEMDKAGWRIVDRPATRFRRSPDMRTLPEPQRGGSINALRPLLNISDDAAGDDDFILAIAFELACEGAGRTRSWLSAASRARQNLRARRCCAASSILAALLSARCRGMSATYSSPRAIDTFWRSTTCRACRSGCQMRFAASPPGRVSVRGSSIPMTRKRCSMAPGRSSSTASKRSLSGQTSPSARSSQSASRSRRARANLKTR
jgi:hypothetical protein